MLVVAAAAVVAVPSASGIESTIYPGVGIGKIRLGMTKAQVERVLGRDHLLNAREGAYTELAWDFATWTVGFVNGRTVQVETSLRSQRTTKGIGPGASWFRVVHMYPGGACTWGVRFGADGHPVDEFPEYLIGRRGGTQTLWRFKTVNGIVQLPVPVVAEAIVRTDFRRLPEFAPSWAYRCAKGWQNRPAP